jgi:hypothetical protein
MRMLSVFGVPGGIALVGLGIAGGVLTYRMDATRLFVVLFTSLGHFAAYWMTANIGSVENNPTIGYLVWNAVQLCLPWALPAIGSAVSLQLEKRGAKENEPKPLTEESLLAEVAPVIKTPVIDYDDLRDIDELSPYEMPAARLTTKDPRVPSPSPVRAADSNG